MIAAFIFSTTTASLSFKRSKPSLRKLSLIVAKSIAPFGVFTTASPSSTRITFRPSFSRSSRSTLIQRGQTMFLIFSVTVSMDKSKIGDTASP